MSVLRVLACALAVSNILGAQAAAAEHVDAAVGEVGKVTWAPCDLPQALNGTECGYIMCVL